jgi:hypothetical protein
MKTSRNLIVYGVIALLAIGLTFASMQFVRPINCHSFCDPAEGAPCSGDSCRIREQRAGLPLPIQVDDPGGGSPTDGWGILGPEDPLNVLNFLLDAVFYFALLGLLWYLIQIVRGSYRTMKPMVAILLLIVVLTGIMVGLRIYLPILTR